MIRATTFVLAALPALVVGCSGPRATVPLYDDLGTYHRAAEGCSEAAQRYLDQGLKLYYGFNHDEAIRSFAHRQEIRR